MRGGPRGEMGGIPEQPSGVGEVKGAYGIEGAVWVRPYSAVPGRAPRLSGAFLVRPGSDPVPVRVAALREAEGSWLVTFEGVSTRADAEALRGAVLAVAAAAVPPLPAGTWYVAELVGREVVADDGNPLGRITGVMSTGANDCWEIAAPAGEILFPALKSLVVDVPAPPAPIVVRVPPGLLDACLTRRKQ